MTTERRLEIFNIIIKELIEDRRPINRFAVSTVCRYYNCVMDQRFAREGFKFVNDTFIRYMKENKNPDYDFRKIDGMWFIISYDSNDISKIIKDKEKLLCYNYKNELLASYNFITKEFTPYSDSLFNLEGLKTTFDNLADKEWIFNYQKEYTLNQVQTISQSTIGEYPDGFKEYVESAENDSTFVLCALVAYREKLEAEIVKKEDGGFGLYFYNNSRSIYKGLKEYGFDFIKLRQMICQGIKSGDGNSMNYSPYILVYNLWYAIINYDPDFIMKRIDYSKSISQNMDNIKNLELEVPCPLYEKFKDLDGKVYGDLIVSVPKTVGDLKYEGEHNKNCIYNCYKEDVLRKTYTFFFVRKCQSPEKSYITVGVGELNDPRFTTLKTANQDLNKEEKAKIEQILTDIKEIIQNSEE